MVRILLLLTWVLCSHRATAQLEKRFADRHARITELHKAGDHAGTIQQIELQLQEVAGTTWQDSIYAYTYMLGRSVWRTEDAEAGLAAARRIAARVKEQDGDVVHQASAMDDVARLLSGMGRMLECVGIDSAALVFVDQHTEFPLSRRGLARQRLAQDYAAMGDHERALKFYLDARSVYEKCVPQPGLNLADACNGAGSACWHLGRTREAEAYYKQALAHLEKTSDPRRNFRLASTVANMGILWQSAGDFSRSKANYLESIRYCEEVVNTTDDPVIREEAIIGRTRGYVNLATVYFAMGDDGRSRQLLEMALRDRQAILEPDDPKLLGVQDRLADLEIEAGNFAQAEVHVRRYLEACEKYFGPRSEEYMRACAKLGEVCAGLQRTARADSLFDLSIALHSAMEDADTDPDLAMAYRRRAEFRIDQGRIDDAIGDLTMARSIIERGQGEENHKLALYDLLLAQAAFARNDMPGARRYADSVLVQMNERVQALKTSPLPQTFSQPYLLPDAIYWKVKAERAMGGSSAVTREQWSKDLDLAVLSLARNKAALDDEGSRLGLIGKEKNLFHLAIDVAYEQWERDTSSANLDHLLNLTEADRSILLKSRLNDFSGMRFAGMPDSILTREGQLIDALEIDPEDPASTQDLDKREQALADFLTRLSKDHPQYFALRYGEPHVSIADLRKRLVTPEQNLLAYAVTGEHLYMLVVRMDKATLVRTSNKGLASTVKAMNDAVAARDAAQYIRSAHALHQLAFAPVAHLLPQQRLLIIPDGELHRVNFEALIDAPCTPTDFRKHLLIQRHAIAYLLSATTAVQFAGLAGERSSKVLAMAPGFADELKQDYLARMEDTTLVDRDFLNYVRQPFAVTTANQLGSLLSAKVMVGNEASEAGFRELAGKYGVLHLGTHAEMNATTPMYSRLVLSKDGRGVDADNDGYLHAYEIYELDLRAELAVLTACQTGAGKDDDGEGVRSLGYGFAYAGCPSLVVALWSIDEKVSSEIITRFYELLADGMPKHEALRQAKLDHLAMASEELALPYYWAGMVLVGDVEPIKVGPSGWAFVWWGLAGLGACIIGFLVWRRKRQ